MQVQRIRDGRPNEPASERANDLLLFTSTTSVPRHATQVEATKRCQCADLRVRPAMIRAVAAAQNLLSLSLTLPASCKANALAPLESHAMLRTLSLTFDGHEASVLPRDLPALESLALAVGPYVAFDWSNAGTRLPLLAYRAERIFRGDGSRRRRGCDVDIPRRHAALTLALQFYVR